MSEGVPSLEWTDAVFCDVDERRALNMATSKSGCRRACLLQTEPYSHSKETTNQRPPGCSVPTTNDASSNYTHYGKIRPQIEWKSTMVNQGISQNNPLKNYLDAEIGTKITTKGDDVL